MATFTWVATTVGGANPWETMADWINSPGTDHPASFTVAPGNDYLISNNNGFTINQIGTGGPGSPDVANSITLSSLQAKLLMADGGGLDVSTTLSLSSLLNMGTITGGSVLSMGGAASAGTINLGSKGILEGAKGDQIINGGTAPAQITGSGTVLAEGGLFLIGTSVQVTGTLTHFQIDPNATLSFADSVAGGTIVFGTTLGPSGSSVLDVGAFSTFNATFTELSVGVGKNTETSFIDFVNVGTDATATLTNVTTAGATINVFTTSSGSQSFPIVGNFVGKHVNYVSDGAGGTNVFLTDTPCYVAGTAILTPDGDFPVETIQPGHSVMTAADGTLVPRAVIWAGVREIDLTRHPAPESVAPIRFRQGALGPDRPRRDLLLSPDHCLFIDGALIPAKLLVNEMTIVRDLNVRTVSYHHVELDRHAVLIAEGVEAESYLDTGNRAYFSNAGLATILHPEFSINEHLRCWETDACAPLTVRPDLVRPVWERFAQRAKDTGWTPRMAAITTDADIRLMVDGRMLRPLVTEGETVSFVMPAGAGSVRLLSRSVRPGQLRPWLDDSRRLGVAVRSVVLRDRTGETILGADHPALTDGWHAAEHSPDGAPWRWSMGDADLPVVSDGPCVLEITLSETTTYIDELAA